MKTKEQIIEMAMLQMILCGKNRYNIDAPEIFKYHREVDGIKKKANTENMRRLKEYYDGEKMWQLVNTAPSPEKKARFLEKLYKNLLTFAIDSLEEQIYCYENYERSQIAEKIERLQLQPFN